VFLQRRELPATPTLGGGSEECKVVMDARSRPDRR